MRGMVDPRPGAIGHICDWVEFSTRMGLGLVVFARSHSIGRLRACAADSSVGLKGDEDRRRCVRDQVPAAAVALCLAAQSAVLDWVARAGAWTEDGLTRAGRLPIVEALAERCWEFLEAWDARYGEEAEAAGDVVVEYLAHVGPTALDALLARIDLAAVVGRVDMDAALDRVDLERLMDRMPVDRLVDQVDLRAVVLDTVAQVQVTDILRESTGAMANRLTGGRLRRGDG